jgi:glycogen operon protein
MNRIDTYPTHAYNGFKLRPGRPYPFGASLVPGGVNFSIYSRYATDCVLVLFEKGAAHPLIEIPFRGTFQKPDGGEPFWDDLRIGHVFTMLVFDLDYEEIEYGFRMDGPGPKVKRGQPGIHRFDPTQILLDPYAKSIGGRDVWGEPYNPTDLYPYRARLIRDDFDWEGERPLDIPIEDLVIYELHVRGFTRHPSAGVKYPGTFAAIHEKIPYLKELGINCVEFMPVFEFDEFENFLTNPQTGEPLRNYWGYSTVAFFAPKTGYAITGRLKDGTMVADEFKMLIKTLHQNGIEVLLDVVFNHTAEGNTYGPTISFRGIDNKTYYMLTPDGNYHNFSGTGNTLNCNHPIVRNMVLDCLRYWVSEYHIDGFRFDLASIMGRDPTGHPLANPPLLEALAYDPILGRRKLIAEAWDAGGLYQVGSFPAYGRWSEWNGKYRDTVRRFLRGDYEQVGELMQRIQGSPDLYTPAGRGPTASINFITCHDGFTLADLVSFNDKHNLTNGENNSDGSNHNFSWNYGHEGPTTNPAINTIRRRQMKNAAAILLVSQGVPMILMGDEMGRTQHGNNNSYCQDNELNWLDWSLLERNHDLFRFFKNCIAFRQAHPILRCSSYFPNRHCIGHEPDITWHGVQPWQADWEAGSRVIAFMLCEKHVIGGQAAETFIYVALNMHWDTLRFELPDLPHGMHWYVFANTHAPPPEDSWPPGKEPFLSHQHEFPVAGHAVVILVGR